MPFRYNGLVHVPEPDTMRALPHGGNRRRLAHGARRLVAGKSATSATRARRETQWERAKGQTLVLFITSKLHFTSSMPASPARPPGAALGARALATRLYPTFSSTATRIARRGATRNALSPPQTAHTILLISVCRVGAKTGISTY